MGISDKTIISKEEIINYIPQRSPIVMVDSFFGVDDDIAVSGLSIDSDNMFCEKDIFSECGIIEHIAQSAALRVGYVCKKNNEPVPVGFIGAVNKCHIAALPHIGDTLKTEIKIEKEVLDITLISATVKNGNQLVANCMMKIALQK